MICCGTLQFCKILLCDNELEGALPWQVVETVACFMLVKWHVFFKAHSAFQQVASHNAESSSSTKITNKHMQDISAQNIGCLAASTQYSFSGCSTAASLFIRLLAHKLCAQARALAPAHAYKCVHTYHVLLDRGDCCRGCHRHHRCHGVSRSRCRRARMGHVILLLCVEGTVAAK